VGRGAILALYVVGERGRKWASPGGPTLGAMAE